MNSTRLLLKGSHRSADARMGGEKAARRGARGSTFPLIVFGLSVFIAFIALTADVMRVAYTTEVINFGAQSAALSAYAYATNPDGTYDPAQARTNMIAQVEKAGGVGLPDAWHRAPAGPDKQSGTYDSPVSFSDSDVTFVNNPNQSDPQDFFLRVRARRDGTDSLRMIFLPAIYAFNTMLGMPMPAGVDTAAPYRITEVVSQPASRIGQGSPKNSPGGTRDSELAGFAAFPIAISNQQFLNAAQPGATTVTYNIDLIQSNQAPPPVQANRWRGCFVNLAPTGGLQYYGSGQGNLAIDELNHTLQYFAPGAIAQAIAPGVVERGSRVIAFDPADPIFEERKAQIIAAAQQVPVGSNLIVPVLRNDPVFGGAQNEVVGFARLRLRSMADVQNNTFTISFDVAESVPVRNASFANGLAVVPVMNGSLMPAPVAPFIERRHDAQDGSIEQRYRGIAMAPSLSPRAIPK